MRTFPVLSELGEKRAFEIENVYVGVTDICNILKQRPEVRGVVKRRLFENNEVHVRFEYAGLQFIVWEPYGDNSRYWVGEELKCSDPRALEEIEAIFKSYRPSLLRQIMGDILTLKFLTGFSRKNYPPGI